jgi:nicotinamidase-related amidase
MRNFVVVVDYQVDFVDGTLGSEFAQSIYRPLLDYINEEQAKGSVIIATLDTHEDDYHNTQEGKLLPVKHCVRGTKGHELYGDLKDFEFDAIIEKDTFGYHAWDDIDLSDPNEGDTITLVGVATNICVIYNAFILKTLFPEVKVVVKKDLCASYDRELHDMALKIMMNAQVIVE